MPCALLVFLSLARDTHSAFCRCHTRLFLETDGAVLLEEGDVVISHVGCYKRVGWLLYRRSQRKSCYRCHIRLYVEEGWCRCRVGLSEESDAIVIAHDYAQKRVVPLSYMCTLIRGLSPLSHASVRLEEGDTMQHTSIQISGCYRLRV